MWVLRSYNSDDDRQRVEIPLPSFDVEVGAELLGHEPTRYGSTPLDRRTVVGVAERFGEVVADDAGVEWFLDFDDDSGPTARPGEVADRGAARG
jgi:hypothetical protein